jgi:hypothetical protein
LAAAEAERPANAGDETCPRTGVTNVIDDERTPPDGAEADHEKQIRATLERLGRPHSSGGTVIERAALLAEGAAFDATIAWILAHGGEPEVSAAAAPQRGLYGSALDVSAVPASGTPRRFVLPAGALKE